MNLIYRIQLFQVLSFIHLQINIQKFRTQINMQFMPLPLVTFIRPTFTMPSYIQLMSLALSTDFKKFILTRGFNEFPQSQKSDKHSQNNQTNISTISLEDVIQRKNEEKEVEQNQKNRKQNSTLDSKIQGRQKYPTFLQKKRESFKKARFQITQALEQSQEIDEISESEKRQQKEEKITNKNDSQSDNNNKVLQVSKQKKIKKSVKIQKVQKKPLGQTIITISTAVSLIDTIEHPIKYIDRKEIQNRKISLLERSIVSEQFEGKKFSYQIRQRRQLKKLN